MTYKEFLAELEALDATWNALSFAPRWTILRCARCNCPITADVSKWSDAADAIGLPYDEAYNIVQAADAGFNAYMYKERIELLSACGLWP